MVSCCPRKHRVVGPVPNGLYKWLINEGRPNHLSKSWDNPPSILDDWPKIQKVSGPNWVCGHKVVNPTGTRDFFKTNTKKLGFFVEPSSDKLQLDVIKIS